MIRIGLIGRGHMGARHAAAYAAIGDVEVRAPVGRTGWRVVLADPSIDAVDVTFPTAEHAAVVGAALEAGKHVLCETPLAENAGQGRRLTELARASGCHLQVALLQRFAEPGPRMREIVRSGTLGTLRALTVRRLAPGTSGVHHGDALLELMLFDLDWVLWTLGHVSVVGAAAAHGPTGRLDHATALLACGGTLLTIEASYLAPRGTVFRHVIEAYGDDGAADAEFRVGGGEAPSCRVRRWRAQEPPTLDCTLGPEPVAAECRHFVDVLQGRADPALLDASQAAAALELHDEIRRRIRLATSEGK